MFKTLIATCLLTFSSCAPKSSPVLNENDLVYTQKRELQNSNQRLSGVYNWVDIFDDSGLDNYILIEPQFEDTLNDVQFLTPIWLDDYISYIKYISLEYDSGYLTINFFVYTYSDVSLQYSFGWNGGDSIDDIVHIGNGATPNFKDLMFNIRKPFNLSYEDSILWNRVFTRDDNFYVTTYNGYYNFLNGVSSIGYDICVFGYINFDNYVYYGFTNNIDYYLESSKLFFDYYNTELNEFNYREYELPFNNNITIYRNILMNGCKMSTNTYTVLSNKGVFSYVRDTSYDDTDFGDLLFTIADTPVYFISQFLNFELFGMNLFIALSGLITLLVVIFIIRKIY